MKTEPDYSIHESRYRERRDKQDVYAGWFTERDYDNGMEELQASLAMGFAPASGDLLDIGCGAGNYSVRLARLGYAVTGVDISNTAIDWAIERAAEQGQATRFVCGDGITLADFEDDRFDFAFDGQFLHCIIGRDRERFLKSVHRVLRPGGFLMVRSIVWPLASGGGLEVDPETRIGYLNGTPWRYYPTAEDLVTEIERADFEVKHWRYTLTLDDGYGFQHVVVQCESVQVVQ